MRLKRCLSVLSQGWNAGYVYRLILPGAPRSPGVAELSNGSLGALCRLQVLHHEALSLSLQ